MMKLYVPTYVAFALLNLFVFDVLSEGFDSREATIEGIHNALFNGFSSCRDVVSSHLARIEAFNPTINAVITLDPSALSLADEKDREIGSGNGTGSLFCIPVLLKDNFDAVGMSTTGGSLSLAENIALVDAPSVAALKKAGAIILGKTNLHELALEGISVSSLGGQTVNPYDHGRTPGGSSGGTGAAIATNFAVLGTGSDTVNSLRSPASANSLFSFRPTRGLISRASIIPVSYTQDTIGAMARNVRDLAIALTVMASVAYDESDNATALVPASSIGVDYSGELYGGSLRGQRFGVIQGFFNLTLCPETTPVNKVMEDMICTLEAAGATVVFIEETIYNATALLAFDVQTAEFREAMDAYLQRPSKGGTHHSTLKELYDSKKFVVLPAQYDYVNTALKSSTSNTSYIIKKLAIQNIITATRKTFAAHDLNAFIYPEQKNLVVKLGSPSQVGRNGILAALTGFPVVTVPAGFSPPTDQAPIGIPIGMEIMGLPWSEGKLLNIAGHISGIRHVRRMPPFANGSVEVATYKSVPIVTPNTESIAAAYPIGVL